MDKISRCVKNVVKAVHGEYASGSLLEKVDGRSYLYSPTERGLEFICYAFPEVREVGQVIKINIHEN